MNFHIGVTDNQWFEFLSSRKPDEVNFWRPEGGAGFAALDQGEPFLFKLHSPQNFIVGGGFFVRFTRLPLSMAWNVFEEKNGCESLSALREKILRYREKPDLPEMDPTIGCIVLAVPFFFEREMWMSVPSDWSPHIQQGKGYSTETAIGKDVWRRVLDRIAAMPSLREVGSEIRKRGPLYVIEARLGQGAFRASVMDAYHRKCAISGERTMPALQAAHIRPYKQSGPNRVSNGLLLRADLHQIFDQGYLTVTPDHRILVSKRIKEEFENGKEYYQFQGTRLGNLPDKKDLLPASDLLEWHYENVYRK